MKHATPIVAIVLLLLLVLYVGSYLALVKPSSARGGYSSLSPNYGYRIDGQQAARFFWPLEQIDRKVHR